MVNKESRKEEEEEEVEYALYFLFLFPSVLLITARHHPHTRTPRAHPPLLLSSLVHSLDPDCLSLEGLSLVLSPSSPHNPLGSIIPLPHFFIATSSSFLFSNSFFLLALN